MIKHRPCYLHQLHQDVLILNMSLCCGGNEQDSKPDIQSLLVFDLCPEMC